MYSMYVCIYCVYSLYSRLALTFEPILGEFAACSGAGDVIAYNVMSNILKPKQHKRHFQRHKTSTMKHKQTRLCGKCGAMWGGWVTSETATKYYFNILKTEAAQTKLSAAQTSTNGAQTNKTILREFGACGGLSDVIAYISMYILKTEAAQTKILTAQTSTNEAQTMLVLGEFGACGGAGDVIAYNSMSNILKTEAAAQTKILTAQTSTNEAQTIEPVLGEFGACGGAESPQNDL